MVEEMDIETTHSKEFEIDLTVEELIAKLMLDQLTVAEEARYKQLLAQRSRMMRPMIATRFRRRALA